uniref:Ig-like domain-containing protein n=1 Tax=Poecilia formosa TaxID=48698 RepID=A0A096LXD8_POEFO
SPAALTVSPSRSQFFEGESVTLICEDGNISDGGTVRRNTTLETRTECDKDGWWRKDGSTCKTSSISKHDSGLYWCESMSGSSSSSSSIQLSVSAALTVSPSRSQFFEGESVTLTCEDENSSDGGTVRRNTTLETRTECDKDGWWNKNGSTCKTSSIEEHDSGLYWCESMSGSSSSSSIQLSVSGKITLWKKPTSSPPASSPLLVIMFPLGSLCLVFLLVLLVLLILLLYSSRRGSRKRQTGRW